MLAIGAEATPEYFNADREGQASAVIDIDQGGNKYLLDGACHRMRFSERWALIKQLRLKWEAHSGLQNVSVGYEQYGMLDDISVWKS